MFESLLVLLRVWLVTCVALESLMFKFGIFWVIVVDVFSHHLLMVQNRFVDHLGTNVSIVFVTVLDLLKISHFGSRVFQLCLFILTPVALMGKGCHIVDASRAAGLAVHSAASLAVSSSKEAARLLRAAEGLVRSATAVLMAAQGSTDSAARRVSSPGLGEDSGQHAGKGNGRGKRSKSRAGRRDWKCSACSAHCFGSKAACYKCGAARPSVASADAKMAAECGGDEFDDSWADSCRRGPASAGALDDSKSAVTEVVDAAPTGARRQLVARGSRERSP